MLDSKLFPGFVIHHIRNGHLINTKFFGQLSLVKFTSRILTSYFRCDMSIDFSSAISILRKHISHVVFMGSEKQMFRIYASRIVAAMADMKFSNASICQFVSDSMCFKKFLSYTKDSVTFFVGMSRPFPAFMKWNQLNFGPKSFHSLVLP